ncbi:hypothetical protein SY83_16610 [Paenibacillus swuensis]|uniref:Uncharacterized protein n=1 Tax=Paenibacillus swuensis TaxID=1178515 RepID=A0A172TQ91_9BACL|nr:hypothetical protein SY83_16610 [Paenibacillus swuensis]
MEQKRCLFCEKIVYAKVAEDHYVFRDCYCAPDAAYEMGAACYEPFNTLIHSRKRELFPLLSGYIREHTDTGHPVRITVDDLDHIVKSPMVPLTLETKGEKLLQFLHRHANGPNEPVILHQLTHSFNLTYSPNMQEFVYILEMLKTDMLLDRVGPTIKLTEKGWRAALASLQSENLKHCCVLVTSDKETQHLWSSSIIPAVEQCGYLAQYPEFTPSGDALEEVMRAIDRSELVIADLNPDSDLVYFASGYTKGKQMPIIWTIHQDAVPELQREVSGMRPIVWSSPEELSSLLQHKLMK